MASFPAQIGLVGPNEVIIRDKAAIQPMMGAQGMPKGPSAYLSDMPPYCSINLINCQCGLVGPSIGSLSLLSGFETA